MSANTAAVVGAGGWGTALACVLSRAGHRVRLWARRPELAAQLQTSRQNDTYLSGVTLPPSLVVTSDLTEALCGAGLVIFATPTQALREVAGHCRPFLSEGALLVSAAKGVEIDTLCRPSEILTVACAVPVGERALTLSGPNFALEIGRELPAASVIAASKVDTAAQAQAWFAGQQSFRVYTHDDLIGVELGGALKNVIAIVAGMAEGLGLGLNARAALITRGLAEITRLGVAMGAKPLTFAGLSGMGDLVLTCTGSLSRNQWAGRELGAGRSLADILGSTPMVIEGVSTTAAAWTLAQRHGVEMPLTKELHAVLFAAKPVKDVLRSLLSRGLRDERDYVTLTQNAGSGGHDQG